MASLSEIQKDFLNLLKGQSLSQGYIFFGELLAEQFLFAKKIANYLENNEWAQGVNLIDAFFIEGQEDSIGIDAIRTVINFLWLKPIKSLKRTLVINNGHKLTTEAQNALLKISEEPPENSLIILVMKEPEVLVSPLVSRFQKIYFSNTTSRQDLSKNENGTKELINRFLDAGIKERKELIKEVVEDSKKLENFVKLLIAELSKDSVKNYKVLKELLGRWKLINQYNVNKKLQLEAALLDL